MPQVLIALTRAVPPAIVDCELTHLKRQPIDVALAIAQHAQYEQALRNAGCEVIHVDPAPEMPDSVFIEDTALVLDEFAIITRPGAESRRGETIAVADKLGTMRRLVTIDAAGTLDGGDVLRVGKRLFAGASTRTNEEGVRQLRALVEPAGYSLDFVPVPGALHLKSAITAVGDRTLIANSEALADLSAFRGFEIIEVDQREEGAANVLRIGDQLLVPSAAARTIDTLRARGLTVIPVDLSELAKAEAGLTCCSLIFEV